MYGNTSNVLPPPPLPVEMALAFIWPGWFLDPSANEALKAAFSRPETRASASASAAGLQAAYGPLMQTGTEKAIADKRLCTNDRPRSYTGMRIGFTTPSTAYVFPYILSSLQPSVARELHSIQDFIALYAIHHGGGTSSVSISIPPSIHPEYVRTRIANADVAFLNTFSHRKMSELKKDGIEMTYDIEREHWTSTGQSTPEYASFPDIQLVLEAAARAAETNATIKRLCADVSVAVLGIHKAIASCSPDVQTSIREHTEGLLKAQAGIAYVEAISLYNTAKVEDARVAFEEEGAIAQLLGVHVEKEKTASQKFIETEYMGYVGGVAMGGGEGGRLRLRNGLAENVETPSSDDNITASITVRNAALHAVLECRLGADIDPKTITLLSATLYRGIHDSKDQSPADRLKHAAVTVRDTPALGSHVLDKMRSSGFQVPPLLNTGF